MRRSSLLSLVILGLAMTCSGGPAHAAFVTVIEPTEAPPTAATDLVDASITTAPEFATVSGVAVGGDAASLGSPGGFIRFAVLTEPPEDPFGPRISDIIRLTVGPLVIGGAAPFRSVTVDFFSDGFPGFDSIIPAGLLVPGIEETGQLQDVSSLLDVNPQALLIRVSSDFASVEVAEPTPLVLLGLGIAGAAWLTRRRGRSC